MSQSTDVRQLLDSWPYDPDNCIRVERGADGREFLQVRLPMGLEEYEVEGRPDGKRVQNSESALEYQRTRLAAAKSAGAEDAFKISSADCVELFDEGTLWYYRLLHFCRLKDWMRVERDTMRNLQLLDFLNRFAEQEEDRARLEPWRPRLTRVNAAARAMILLEKGRHDEALKIARESFEGVGEEAKNPRELAQLLLEQLRGPLTRRPAFRPREDAAFLLRGDYWTIRYQGQVARLRTTRGLQCLASLLRRPGKEFHVSELIAEFVELPAEVEGAGTPALPTPFPGADPLSSGPILDARAKSAYRHRLKHLREDLSDAEGFGDRERTARVQEEMNCIAEQLATAVGLGGKERAVGSHAERARSTVTKRIKDSINKIGQSIPGLGRHLSARVKTGYFCSYNPHPDRPVAWKF